MDEDTIVTSLNDFEGMKTRRPPVRREDLFKCVVEYSFEGQFLKNYSCAAEVARTHNIHPSTVANICNGRFLFSKKTKTIFLYRGDDIVERLKKINPLAKKLSPHATRSKEVYEYTLGGRLLFKWPSTRYAAISNKLTPNVITNCCKGRRLFVDKRIFLYPEGNISERVKEVKAELYKLSQKRPKYREVDEYSLSGDFIKSWVSASAAARYHQVPVSNITRCCKGVDGNGHLCMTTKGKIFLWVGDSISERINLIKSRKND